jgi:glycosyltransferase involved in cell wall biosynthesis
MRILHILHGKTNPDALNGVSKIGHWMATSQVRLGHDVEMWGLTNSMTMSPRAREYRMRLFPITRLRVVLGREIKAALRELSPDTWVHFHSVFCPEFPSIAHVLRERGIPYGVSPHGGYSPGVLDRHRLKHWLYIALRERRYLAGATWTQATGIGEVGDIRALAPEANLDLIPNGQEHNLLAEIEVPQMASKHPVVGFCGRLSIRQKGLDFLVAGFSAYKANGGRGQLWLIGDDVDRPVVERMAERGGAGSDVRFFGAMTGAEKLKVIANFDVFIHSSRWEGLPMACLEALALGRPLLVSRETNLAEYVERSGAGLVLDETSAPGVKRVLERVDELYENGQLEHMSANALSLARREFRWEENARSFVAAVEKQKRRNQMADRRADCLAPR